MHSTLQSTAISYVRRPRDYRSSRVIPAFLGSIVQKKEQEAITATAGLSRRATYIAGSFHVLSLSTHSFHRFEFRAMHSAAAPSDSIH